MKNNKLYYSLYQEEKTAVLNIFGDITSYAWEEFGEMSNVLLSKKLEELKDVDTIDVYINSYGGEVAEGLAIYNALKRHKAKIITHIDGFACSIASVIFMAGDERIMPKTSCLMIHNPWTHISGNAEELRKQADDLEIIGECSVSAYMEHVNISEEELKVLLDNESWISSKDAVELGFATAQDNSEDSNSINQSVKSKVVQLLLASKDNRIINKSQKDNDLKENNRKLKIEKKSDGEDPSQKASNKMVAFFNSLEEVILK